MNSIQKITSRFSRKSQQEQLIEFVTDEKIISKAVKGSMEKRIELLERVELKQKHAH